MSVPRMDPSPGGRQEPIAVPDPKIHSRHRTRQALIYVRQSHPNQVRHHPESARRQ